VLLFALWVRSYWRIDVVGVWNCIAVDSVAGAIGMDSNENQYEPLTLSTADSIAEVKPYNGRRFFGVRFEFTFRRPINFVMPYWFATLLAAALTILSSGIYRKRQFSLRMLLLATTLVAVRLGIVVVLG
jgi:hypothetical protein